MNTCKRCKHDSIGGPNATQTKTFRACACTCHDAWRFVNHHPRPKAAKVPVAKKAPTKATPRKRAAVKS